jgi:hypothetical protein
MCSLLSLVNSMRKIIQVVVHLYDCAWELFPNVKNLSDFHACLQNESLIICLTYLFIYEIQDML